MNGLPLHPSAKDMVVRFQCQGCQRQDIKGAICSYFKLDEIPGEGDLGGNGFRCLSHLPIQTVDSLLYTNLPAGFQVSHKPHDEADLPITALRLHLYPMARTDYWDNLNLPVWALEFEGCLFVRTYSPRLDQSFIDIFNDAKMDLIKQPVIDVATLGDGLEV